MNNLREIQALRKLAPHPNVINLEEVLYDEPTGRLAMVFELMDANLYDLISGKTQEESVEIHSFIHPSSSSSIKTTYFLFIFQKISN